MCCIILYCINPLPLGFCWSPSGELAHGLPFSLWLLAGLFDRPPEHYTLLMDRVGRLAVLRRCMNRYDFSGGHEHGHEVSYLPEERCLGTHSISFME